MNSAWQVRAGRQGERDDEALKERLAIVGWDGVPDLSEYRTKSELRDDLVARYPTRSTYVLGNWTGQLWRFSHEMTSGDLVVMPLKSRGLVAIGTVVGEYSYRTDAAAGFRHVRRVDWTRVDVDRKEFAADLRSSLGSLLTVCKLSRHDAPRRLAEIAAGRLDPGWRHQSASVEAEATLADLWEAVATGGEPVRLTVRELLAKWGYTRRTATSLAVIKSELADRGIVTSPSFAAVRMDAVVEFVTAAAEPGSDEAEPLAAELASTHEAPEELPVKWTVSAVVPTEASLVTVMVGSELSVAVTRMLTKNFSQLPVVDAHGYYQGAVSWESIGKARMANPRPTLRQATVQVRVVDHDDNLFDQIDEIYRHGFVLVRGEDRHTLAGIVTAHDLARQFGTMARPFSLIEEGELRLRRQVRRMLPEDKIAKHAPKWGNGLPTFGGYGRLLDDRANFQLLGWDLDHQTFMDVLKAVKDLRNELMHFSRDDLSERELNVIDGFVAMLRTVDRDVADGDE